MLADPDARKVTVEVKLADTRLGLSKAFAKHEYRLAYALAERANSPRAQP